MKKLLISLTSMLVSIVCAQVGMAPLSVRLDVGQTGQAQSTFTVFNG